MKDESSIDVFARRETARIFRRFAVGSISNDEMYDALPASREESLHEIFMAGIWPLYDDTREHWLTGRDRLSAENREDVARLLLFLYGSTPYRWPPVTGWLGWAAGMVSLATLGLWHPLRRRVVASGGDEAVWPFFDRTEYEAALENPPFLAASRQPT
jgi:hypothetical protein